MKTHLILLALLVSASSVLADSTPFLPRRTPAPIPVPQREPSRYAPYSRTNAHFATPTPATAAPRQESSVSGEHVAPYNRSSSRFQRPNA